MFYLFNAIAALILITLDHRVGSPFSLEGASISYGWFYTLYSLIIIVPALAVSVRRLHDIGKSGWFYFISLIPFGWFVVLYWFCKDSQPGTHKWGNNSTEVE